MYLGSTSIHSKLRLFILLLSNSVVCILFVPIETIERRLVNESESCVDSGIGG